MLFDYGSDLKVDDAVKLGSFPFFYLYLFISDLFQEGRTAIEELLLLKEG